MRHAYARTLVGAIAFVVLVGTGELQARLPHKNSDAPSASSPPQIIIGTEKGYPPYSFIEANKPNGFNVEISAAIARVSGLAIEIRYAPWKEIKDSLQTGHIQAISGMYYSKQRDLQFDFTPPYAIIHHAIFAHKNSPSIRSVEQLRGKKIIVMKGDITHDYVLENKITEHITTANSIPEAIALLSQQNHDFALAAKLPALYWIKKQHINGISISGPPILPSKYCFAVAHGNSDLLYQLNEALMIIKTDGTYQYLFDKWLGVLDSAPVSIESIIKIAIGSILLLILLLSLFFIWTRSLKLQVAQRTQTLNRQIHQRMLAEEHLRKQRQQLQVTLESIADGVITTDISGNILLINKVAAAIIDVNPVYQLDRNIAEILTIQQADVSLSAIISFVTKHKTMYANQKSIYIQKVSSGSISISLSAAPILSEDEAVLGIVFAIQDTTEKERIEKALRRSTKLDSLGVLAGGIAHDFNNLLAGIYGNIDLSISHCTDERVKKHLEKTIDTIDRASSLTSQLLTFAKGGAPVKQIAEITPFLRDAVQFVLSGSNIKSTFSFSADLWYANFDKSQIAQVIDNIVINAMHAMPEGGTVRIRAQNCESQNIRSLDPGLEKFVKISISDTGKGIAPEVLPLIFDPFFSTKSDGHGLGLATSYSVISQHGGSIEVESQINSGTTFHIFLPAAEEIISTDLPIRMTTWQTSGKILIMDDEQTVAQMLKDILENMGFDVVSATNGEQVIELFSAQKKSFQAMILDLTIPGGMGGQKTAERIRLEGALMPIFAISGYGDDPVMANPEIYGFNDSIKKPFRLHQLQDILQKHVAPFNEFQQYDTLSKSL